MSDIENKLAAARARLILDRPFLGALVMRLPLIEADPTWCRSIATDARSLYYNRTYIDNLSLEQTQFALAHEALHCALSHFSRRQYRELHRWDLACDFAINPILIAEGMHPCPDALYLAGFEGMSAEEIYPCLDDSDDHSTHDDHIYNDSGDGRGSGSAGQPQEPSSGPESTSEGGPDTGQQGAGGAERPELLSESARASLELQWQQRLAGAAQQARMAGKLSGALGRSVDRLLQPELSWRALLAHYMTNTARTDYSWIRPSRREGDAILPTLKSGEVNVAVGIDTSGSVNDSELQRFLSEIDAIKGQVVARILLLPCDACLDAEAPFIYQPWEPMDTQQTISGGGGSDFTPVFDWLLSTEESVDLLIYFTDALGRFPEQEPSTPVIWLVKGNGEVPWGERIQLN